MKKMKKIASVLLALVMVVAMAMPAFAGEVTPPNTSDDTKNFTITVNNPKDSISIDGQTFSAYKVFDVTYNLENEAYLYTVADAFQNFTYTVAGAEGEEGTMYDKETLVEYVETLTSNSEALNAFAAAVFKYVSDNSIAASGSAVAANEQAVIELTQAGYYLVSGGATNEDGDGSVTAACILDTTNPSVEMQVKADAPSIDKVIVEADSANGEEGKGTAQDVGSTVNFKLTSTVPVMTGYTTYKYIVHDKMTSGLTFNNDVEVTIGGTAYNEITVSDVDADGAFTIDFGNIVGQDEGAEIVITYSATINNNALVSDVETNTVNLEYSNDPYDENKTDKTPDKIVYVYDFDIVINKYADGDESKKLAGAEFYLTNADGKYYQLTTADDGAKTVSWVDAKGDATKLTTDDNGYARFEGLDAGDYQLVEEKAPNGYNKLDGPVDVKITIEYKEDGSLKTSSATVDSTGQLSQTSKIENKAGSLLPSTGGIGTTIFYIVGTILVVGAGILLVTKRRMKEQ